MALPPRSSFVVRLSHELHDSLKHLSEQSGISLNTLVVSVLQWASDHAHVGDPQRLPATGPYAKISTRPAHGVLWIGHDVGEEYYDEHGKVIDQGSGEVFFVIDDRPESRLTRVKPRKEPDS